MAVNISRFKSDRFLEFIDCIFDSSINLGDFSKIFLDLNNFIYVYNSLNLVLEFSHYTEMLSDSITKHPICYRITNQKVIRTL